MGLEQELIQTKIITTNPELQELIDRVNEMARYYYKGFGQVMNKMHTTADRFLRGKASIRDFSETLEYFKEIEELYLTIPFDDLNGKPEFYPLFNVRDILPIVRKHIGEILKGGSDSHLRYNMRQIRSWDGTLSGLGELYRYKFEEVLDKIRTYPEAKDFHIEIQDRLKDKAWFF